ncbi:MAG: alanine dehydrogenase [Bacteroidales bacterium]
MIIGIPKEIKNNENRVAITPAGAAELIAHGHQVFVQKTAGVGSGFPDYRYEEIGVKMLDTIEEVYAKAEMIIKVKEPIEVEYKMVRKGQIVFTYFHFASCQPLTQAMIESESICIAYETVELENKTLPLLMPMSEVAGRMSVQEGAKYLEKTFGGSGILLGGVAGVSPAKVLIIGGGVVGTEAAKMAAGLGASVTIADINLNRLRYLDDVMPANVSTLYCTPYSLAELSKTQDLIIGAVLIPGAKAPKLITYDMIKTMQPGTVLVDVAIDQGGCIDGAKPTTHDNPTFKVSEAIMYSVANMPGAVPRTSTQALTNATLKYAVNIANEGWKKACQEDEALAKGINVAHGKVVYAGVAEAFNLPLHPMSEIL